MVGKYGRSVSPGLSAVGLKALLLRLTFLGELLMHRELVYRLSMVLALVGSAAESSLGQTARTSPVKAKTAAEAYQNVQVLKDIPADQLVPAMQFITYSLGVECSYCHVEGALDTDEKKPKQLTVIHLPNGDSLTAYDGTSGWTAAPNRPVRDIPSVEVASAQPEVDLRLPLDMKQLFSEIKPLAPETIGNRQTYVVAGMNS